MEFRTQYNFKPDKGDVNKGKRVTEDGHAMGMKDLLNSHYHPETDDYDYKLNQGDIDPDVNTPTYRQRYFDEFDAKDILSKADDVRKKLKTKVASKQSKSTEFTSTESTSIESKSTES